MSKDAQPRPGQATLAAWIIIAGSVIVVLSAWQRISMLHTLEGQEQVQQWLADPPFDGLGLSLSAKSTAIRVLCMIGAAAATAAAILGAQVLKRSRSARLALTGLAPVILIAGSPASGFFAPLVAAGTTLLWLQPTRDWYAGRPWLENLQARMKRTGAVRPQDQAPGATGTVGETGQGRSGPDPSPSGPGATTATMLAERGGPRAPGAARARGPRPRPLVTACALTWGTAAIVAVSTVLETLRLLTGGDEQFDEFYEQQSSNPFSSYEPTPDDLRVAFALIAAGIVVWCVVAAALAALAFVGHDWARITLVVSGCTAAVLALLLAIAGPPLLLIAAAIAIAVWLLLRREVAAWFRG